MGTLDWLGQQADPSAHKSEQAVLVHFKYGSTDLSMLVALENALGAVPKISWIISIGWIALRENLLQTACPA